MTASEWDTAGDVDAMLQAIEGRVSDRKMLLFACGCCRLVEGQFPGAGLLAGQFETGVDRPMKREEKFSLLAAVYNFVFGEPHQLLMRFLGGTDQSPWQLARRVASMWRHFQYIQQVKPHEGLPEDLSTAPIVNHSVEQATVLREVVGNPFHPSPIDAAWRTETVRGIASAIEDENAWDRMPILADALQDAGCEDAAILAHCRDTSHAHRRGCWVLDDVLGRN